MRWIRVSDTVILEPVHGASIELVGPPNEQTGEHRVVRFLGDVDESGSASVKLFAGPKHQAWTYFHKLLAGLGAADVRVEVTTMAPDEVA